MRILIYTHAFAPQVGGVETYVMLLARGLMRSQQQESGEEVKVTVVTRTPAGKMDGSALPFRVVRRPSLPTLLRLLWRADVVHLAGPSMVPMCLALICRTPVVVEHHGYQAICPNGLLMYEPTKTVCPDHFMRRRYHKCLQCNRVSAGWVRSLLQLLLSFARRWACKRVTMNLPITHHVDKRIRLPRSQVIYYGIPDASIAARSDSERYQSSPQTPVTFAYVGRLVSEKGLPLLVEAARRLSEAGRIFCVKFIGDGPERPRLEEAVDISGVRHRVTFTGFLQGGDLASALADVTALVMPSIWEETAGLSAMEHMMRGRLVIATDIGGLGEVVGGAGLKFPLGDFDALASCMKRVIDEPSLTSVFGMKATQRTQEMFREERMVAEHLTVYRHLLGKSGRSLTPATEEESINIR